MARKNAKADPMVWLAEFIVDKRNLFFLILVLGVLFPVFSTRWIQVENSLTEYLPSDSETRMGLDVMDEQFITYGTAQIMVENVSAEDADTLCGELEEMKGVQSVDYDPEDDYRNVSALYNITFDSSENDPICMETLEQVKTFLDGQGFYVVTSLGNSTADIIDQEVSVIMVFVAIIVVAVLLLTSQTYAEVLPCC